MAIDRLGTQDIVSDAKALFALLDQDLRGNTGQGSQHNPVTLSACVTNMFDINTAQVLTVDSLAASGDLFTVNAASALARIPIGGSFTFLQSDSESVSWTACPNVANDAFLYLGSTQQTALSFDAAGASQTVVTGASWFFDGPQVNIGDTVGGGGERLALRIDQDATTAMEIVNADSGNSAAANLRIKNAPGAGGDNALAMGVTGTGWNTVDLTVADQGIVQANINLSGGLLHLVRHATAPILFGVANATEALRIDTTEIVANDPGADRDFRVEGDTLTHLLFVQGSTDRIGINEAAPAARLHVSAATTTDIAAIFQTTDDDPTKNLLELRDSGDTPLSAFDAAGNLGVGIAAPAYRVHVAATLTETANVDDYCAYFSATVDPAANSAARMYALFGELTASDNSETSDRLAGVGSMVSVTGDANIVDVRGLSNAVSVSTISDADITKAYGELCTVVHSGSGDLTNVYGGFYWVRRLGAGDLTNAYGLYVRGDVGGGAGSTARNTGLHIASVSGATTNYSIRGYAGLTVFNEPGDADSDLRWESDNQTHMLFGDAGLDRIGIGQSAPVATLDVDQSDNAAGIPVLKLDQVDQSEQCIQFSSDGADRDIYLWTVEVTGAPAFMWDESETAYNIIGADLNFATGFGITHADGVAAGMILLADGTRYVPAVAAGSLPIAPAAVGDTLIATAGPLWGVLTTPGAAGYVRVSTATTEEWSQDPTLTGDWTWTSAASANPVLTIENTNADAAAPTIDFYKNSASPADNDDLGAIDFFGETSTGAQERYAYILAESLDVTNGDTGGGLKFSIVMDATERSFLELAGYNGSVNEGEIVFNQDGQDVDTRIEAVGVPNAFTVRGSDGLVGIWTDTPDGTLHVQSASAGAVTAWGGANEIVVEGIASGISMLSADIGTSELVFGSPSTAQGALASWNFSSLEMRVGPTTANGELVLQSDSGNERARFEAGGNLLMATTLDLNGIADALILDADADTTISAPTDDQIDFEVGGSDIMVVTPTAVAIGDGTGPFTQVINGAAGNARDIIYQSAGSNRWIVRVNSTAEAGANVGSDFQVVARTDAGGALATSLHIQRSTSRVGILNASPGAQLHVDQLDTTATIPVLTLDQADVSEEMINFIVAATGAGNPVDTATAVGTAYARLRIAVNGTFKYIQLYNA